MAADVFSYLLFEPLDPKELNLLKDLTTSGKAWGPLRQRCAHEDGGETRCGKLRAGQLEAWCLRGEPCRVVPAGSGIALAAQARCRCQDPLPQSASLPSPDRPQAQCALPARWARSRAVLEATAARVLVEGKGELGRIPLSPLLGEGVSEWLGVANSESDGSFFCFPEICKVWWATSKYIREELLEKRVSLTSCSEPSLPFAPGL